MKTKTLRVLALAALALAAFPAIGAVPGAILLENYSEGMHLNALAEPFQFNGTCPKDVQKITVNYYAPKDGVDAWSASNAADFKLIESYPLKKYVAGSGTFIYRIHPDLNNLREGVNRYVFIAERKDKTRLTLEIRVLYSNVVAERGGEGGGEEEYYGGAERGGGGDEDYAYGAAAERGGEGGGESAPPSAKMSAGTRGSAESSALSRTSSSGLQASFADDNAQFNYFIGFQDKYTDDVKHLEIPVSERIVLNVTDKAGKPVANAKVKVADGSSTLCEGVTYPDGTFLFFPAQYAAGISRYKVSVTAIGAKADVEIQRDGKREIPVQLQAARPEYKSVPLDILFILDTTGSMSEEIARLKATIEIINLNLTSLPSKPKVRFGMVLFRDRGDAYVTKLVQLTSDLEKFRRELSTVNADGGNDTPEDTQAALREAVKSAAWDPNGARLAFLITDAPPHLDYPDETYTYVDGAKDAGKAGIKVFTVGTGSLDLQGEFILRQISQYTYAKYIFLTYGEKGESEGGVTGSVSHHTGANFQTDKLEAIIIKFAREEISYFTGQKPEEEEDYFEAVKTADEDKAQTLTKLFDMALSQIVDYASISIQPGTPTAVLPIAPQAGATAADAEYFTAQLVQSLAKNASFKAVERKDLQAVMKELEIQASGITDEKQAVELGKVIGAQMLVSGTLFDRGKNYEIFLKLIRVETGEILSVTKLLADKALGLTGAR